MLLGIRGRRMYNKDIIIEVGGSIKTWFPDKSVQDRTPQLKKSVKTTTKKFIYINFVLGKKKTFVLLGS